MQAMRGMFEAHGTDFWFDPDGFYSFENISVGNNVFLGVGCTILAAESKVRIGSSVMFGPHVTIIGGGHNISAIGMPMSSVHWKIGNEDLGVTIEDDVWVGASAIILRGVTVGRGAVIAAGSVVTKSPPPYSVVGGNPARLIRARWSAEQILEHERLVYPPCRRLTESQATDAALSSDMFAPLREPPRT